MIFPFSILKLIEFVKEFEFAFDFGKQNNNEVELPNLITSFRIANEYKMYNEIHSPSENSNDFQNLIIKRWSQKGIIFLGAAPEIRSAHKTRNIQYDNAL